MQRDFHDNIDVFWVRYKRLIIFKINIIIFGINVFVHKKYS